MRVHLGSDHAGLDLKDHLVAWLGDHGYEPVDHGPFVQDPADDYPVFCLRAAAGVAHDRAQGLDSLGVVVGGSGNGEQMAANKVPGIRCALAWSEETARLARQHNDAQVVSVGGRMHSLEDMTRFVELFLAEPFSGDERHERRIAMLADYERTGDAAPAAGLRAGPRAGHGNPTPGSASGDRVPEGHTLHRLAADLDDAFAGSVLRVGSPQGRFADAAALLDTHVLERAEAYGKHLFLDFEADRQVHVHLGLYGKFAIHRGVEEVLDPVGQVRMRLVRADRTAYADLRGATACELQTEAEREVLLARLGPDPLRPGTDPTPAWDRVRRSRAPIAGLLMDQSVLAGIGNVYRAELLFRHRVDPFREGRTLRVGTFRAMWDDLVELMQDGVRIGRIDTMRAEDRPAASARAAAAGLPSGRRARAVLNYVYRHDGRALHPLRHDHPHPGPAGAQPVLVPALPAGLPLPRGGAGPALRARAGWGRPEAVWHHGAAPGGPAGAVPEHADVAQW